MIDYKSFVNTIESVCSDIYFFILIFLLQKKPFSNLSVDEFKKHKKNISKLGDELPSPTKSKLLASPNLNSKFSPSVTIRRSFCTKNGLLNVDNNNLYSKSAEEDNEGQVSELENKRLDLSKDFLFKFSRANNNYSDLKDTKDIKNSIRNQRKRFGTDKLNKDTGPKIQKMIIEANSSIENNNDHKSKINRKLRSNLKYLEPKDDDKSKDINKANNNGRKNFKFNTQGAGDYTNLPLIPAIKKTKESIYKVVEEPDDDINEFNLLKLDNLESVNDVVKNKDNFLDDLKDFEELNVEEEIVKHQGYLYKITEHGTLKKIWFTLLNKDFYFFKNNTDTEHRGMHNLTGTFITEEEPKIIDKKKYFCFSVVYPKKSRFYYVDKEDECKEWIKLLKKATCYSDLNDIYEVKQKLGNGKFGLVNLGIHKKSHRQVAIKVMSKKDMDNADLELVKTEIDILKVCQHPNIIRIYDVFENLDYIYISKYFIFKTY